MLKDELAGKARFWGQLRRLIVPNWIWQFTWLRHLPRYYRSIVWKECTRSGPGVLLDMLYIFFRLRSVPEHYGPYRLWEVPRRDWARYYGSPYTPIQRGRLDRHVYPVSYEVVYDNKLVGAHLCNGLSVRQPVIFGLLEPTQGWRERLTSLLESSGQSSLFMKPVFGRSGIGIVLVQSNGLVPTVHTTSGDVPLSEFELDWPVFLQEVIRQDARLAAVWNSSVNTLRVITLQTPSDEVLILGCAMRFGVGKSYVDNWSAGGVAVGVETQTGQLRKYGYDVLGNRFTQHPSSGFTFEGFAIPQWQDILDAARAVQRELPFSKVVGVDICLDHDGRPVLIEINGLPDFVLVEQLNGPLLADPRVLRVFAAYDLLVSRAQRKLIPDT